MLCDMIYYVMLCVVLCYVMRYDMLHDMICYNNYERKIIKNLGKEIQLDKKI
jgi:hypothetical protein